MAPAESTHSHEDTPMTPSITLVDSTVRDWPDVKARKVFGHMGYIRNSKMFGWQDGEGFSVGKFAEPEAGELEAAGMSLAKHGAMEVRGWYRIPVTDDASANLAIDWLRRAYDSFG